MLSETQQRLIEQASVTVWIREREAMGRGVLVSGQLILTAAHNVIYAIEERSSLPLASTLIGLGMGDPMAVEIKTTHGLLHVAPLAIEPVTDIAVLGALDGQVFFDECEAYEAWCEAVAPVPLCYEQFPFMTPIPVAVYTHRGTWLEGTAQQGGPTWHGFWINMPEGIEGGTSGSPIVTAQGTLAGIVSQAGGTESDALEKGREGYAPRAHLTLPGWVLRCIQAAEEDTKPSEC